MFHQQKEFTGSTSGAKITGMMIEAVELKIVRGVRSISSQQIEHSHFSQSQTESERCGVSVKET